MDNKHEARRVYRRDAGVVSALIWICTAGAVLLAPPIFGAEPGSHAAGAVGACAGLILGIGLMEYRARRYQ